MSTHRGEMVRRALEEQTREEALLRLKRIEEEVCRLQRGLRALDPAH